MQAEIETVDEGTITLGPDSFRHANQLENSSTYVALESNYLLGDHELVAGINHNFIDVFNLFVPNSNGSASYASLDEFEARNAKVFSIKMQFLITQKRCGCKPGLFGKLCLSTRQFPADIGPYCTLRIKNRDLRGK